MVGFTRNNLKVYYTNTHAYPTNIKELLRVHYYDTYPSDTDTRPTSIHSQITLPNNSYPNRSLQGLPVANYVKNIEEDKWTKTWNWYDEKGRVIGTRSNNHHGGYTPRSRAIASRGLPSFNVVTVLTFLVSISFSSLCFSDIKK